MFVVPEEDETVRASNSDERLEGMHCDTADRRVDAAHERVATALTAALDSLEDVTLEAANERVGVRHEEVRAAEVLGVTSGIFLGLALLVKLERRLAVVSLLRFFLRKTDRLNVGETEVIEPGNDLEVKVVELDMTILVASHQVPVMHSRQRRDFNVLSEVNNLHDALLVLVTDLLNYEGTVPDKDETQGSTGDGALTIGDEDGLREVAFEFARIREVALLNLGGIVLQLRVALLPVEEDDTARTVGGQLSRVVRVELDPVLVLEVLGVLVAQRADGAFLGLVGPIPQ